MPPVTLKQSHRQQGRHHRHGNRHAQPCLQTDHPATASIDRGTVILVNAFGGDSAIKKWTAAQVTTLSMAHPGAVVSWPAGADRGEESSAVRKPPTTPTTATDRLLPKRPPPGVIPGQGRTVDQRG